jgi:hypothetical protein
MSRARTSLHNGLQCRWEVGTGREVAEGKPGAATSGLVDADLN